MQLHGPSTPAPIKSIASAYLICILTNSPNTFSHMAQKHMLPRFLRLMEAHVGSWNHQLQICWNVSTNVTTESVRHFKNRQNTFSYNKPVVGKVETQFQTKSKPMYKLNTINVFAHHDSDQALVALGCLRIVLCVRQ